MSEAKELLDKIQLEIQKLEKDLEDKKALESFLESYIHKEKNGRDPW